MEFRIKSKISQLILQLHLLQLILAESFVRINFQDFVFVGFVYYVLFRKKVNLIQKNSNRNYSRLS